MPGPVRAPLPSVTLRWSRYEGAHSPTRAPEGSQAPLRLPPSPPPPPPGPSPPPPSPPAEPLTPPCRMPASSRCLSPARGGLPAAHPCVCQTGHRRLRQPPRAVAPPPPVPAASPPLPPACPKLPPPSPPPLAPACQHHQLRSPPPAPPASARRRPRNAAPAIRRRAATTYSPAPRRCCCSCPPPSPASTTAPRPARRPPHCRGPTRARRPDACAPRLLSSPVTLPCPSRPWPGRGPSCPGLTLRELLQKSAGPRPTRGPSPYHRRGAYARRLGAPRPARDSRVVWSCLLFSVALGLSARPLPRLPPARAFFESTFRSIVLCALAAGAHGPTRCSRSRCSRSRGRAGGLACTTSAGNHCQPTSCAPPPVQPHTWLVADGDVVIPPEALC